MSGDTPQGRCLTKVEDQSFCLFKKYLSTNFRRSLAKTIMEESKLVRRATSPRSLPPPKFGSNLNRLASPLEQKLLPELRCPSKLEGDKSSRSQLTILYEGAVNVYDNVPLDKVQAIMLLASESSLLEPVEKKIPTKGVKTPPCQSSLSEGLPVARRHSLQRFLEKRRDRATRKSPYDPLVTKPQDDDATADNGCNQDHGSTLSPFPSRLGYFFSGSADRDCLGR